MRIEKGRAGSVLGYSPHEYAFSHDEVREPYELLQADDDLDVLVRMDSSAPS
jgi:hypothetical protein